jgi:hypothetical protein
MPPRDSGVTELLHRASDDLMPDVDRLVSGGIARGRTRQRRARIGTTIASLAVIGVVGGLAVVVPQLGGPDSAPDPGIATEGPSPTEEPTPTVTSEPSPVEGALELADFGADEMPTMALELIDSEWAGDPGPLVSVSDQPDTRRVEFALQGMSTTIGITSSAAPSPKDCALEAGQVDGACVLETPDGAPMIRWGPTLADGVTCQGMNVFRGGWEVYVTSCNAAVAKEAPTLAPEPPISMPDLVEIATSDVWFAP